jgi:hypothetical protein
LPTGTKTFLSDPEGNIGTVTPLGNMVVTESFDHIKNPAKATITAASGGVQLESIPCNKVILRNSPDNDIMWFGGTGDDVPFSGHGMEIYPGEVWTLPMKNANQVVLVAQTSGQLMRYTCFTSQEDVLIESQTDEPIDPNYVDMIAPYFISSTTITALFSEEITSGGTMLSGIRLLGSGSLVLSGTSYVDPVNSSQLVFAPVSGVLGSGILHTLQLFSGITDLAGNNLSGATVAPTFTTASAAPGQDLTAPTVSSTTPTAGATSISTTADQTIIFSEQMLSSTITTTNITMKDSANNSIPRTVTLNSTDKITVTVNPTSDLTAGTTYTITVSTGVKDLAGNSMAASYAFSFTTTSAVTQVYNVTGTGGNALFSGDDERDGMTIPAGSNLIGKKIVKMSCTMKKTGSPTGTITVTVRKGVGDTIQTTLGTKDSSTLTTSNVLYTFQNLAGTYALVQGDYILVEYAGGDASNNVSLYRNGTDVDANGSRVHYRGGSYLTTTQDAAFTLYSSN